MATKSLFLSYLYGTITQAAADGFKEAQISTPLSNVSGFAASLREVLIEWPRPSSVPNVNQEISFTRKTMAAMPTILEKSLVLKRKWYGETQGGAGGMMWPNGIELIQYDEANAPLIVESSIFAQVDSNATGLSGTWNVRLGYVLTKISDVDRLDIIANSLQA